MSCFHLNKKGTRCTKKAVENRLCSTHLGAVNKAKDKYRSDMETVPEQKKTTYYKTSSRSLTDDPARRMTYSKGNVTRNLHKDEEGMTCLNKKN